MTRIVYLTPPSISPDHIEEKIVCIRTHRERIFQITSELKDGKIVCHNYGHGGAGWTFLFGSVPQSIRQLDDQLQSNPSYKNKPICVIGAGCYGLLTAIELARKGHDVRIAAKETSNLPSDRAAGFFFPRPRKSSTDQERAQFLSVGMESYAAYLEIAHGTHPYIYDASKLLPAYFDHEIDPGFGPYIKKGLVAAPENVLIDFGNGKQYDVMEYKTVFINPSHIMRELRKQAARLGISIVQQDVTSLDEIEEEIVFNCAGKSAPLFSGDKRIVPVQGHLITLKNQPPMSELQYMINVRVAQEDPRGWTRDTLLYYAPKANGILGITFIRGQADETANMHEFDRLIERAQKYFGATK